MGVVGVVVADGLLRLQLHGLSRWLALSGRFDIPLTCIRSATAGAPGLPHFRPTDLRLGGTSVPGVFAIGRFSMGSPRRATFLALRRSSRQVLALELENHRYDAVQVEVEDVERVLAMIAALGTATSPASSRG